MGPHPVLCSVIFPSNTGNSGNSGIVFHFTFLVGAPRLFPSLGCFADFKLLTCKSQCPKQRLTSYPYRCLHTTSPANSSLHIGPITQKCRNLMVDHYVPYSNWSFGDNPYNFRQAKWCAEETKTGLLQSALQVSTRDIYCTQYSNLAKIEKKSRWTLNIHKFKEHTVSYHIISTLIVRLNHLRERERRERERDKETAIFVNDPCFKTMYPRFSCLRNMFIFFRHNIPFNFQETL